MDEAVGILDEVTHAATPGRERVEPVSAVIDLCIVIVTWNSDRWISRCLRAIPAACEGLSYEVVVYDNASHDASAANAISGGARLIASKANDGFAAGTNRGVAATTGRYVFLLNPDCELAPRALTILFEFLAAHPEAAAAVPLLSDESGHSQREFQLRRLPTLAALASEVLALDKIAPGNRWSSRHRYRELDISHPTPVEQPAGAAMLLRRSVFEEVGPLDERFSPAWFEDVDYCHRLADAGHLIYVVPAAQGRHFGGSSLEQLGFGRFIDLWYRNMWRYARKWFSPGQAETLRWVIMTGMLLRIPAAFLGIAHRDAGRGTAARAYAGVLKRAFARWDDSPVSSW